MSKTLAAIFNFIAKALAVICAALFVLVTIIVLPAFNVERTLTNPATYKRLLVENRVYEQLPALVGEQMDAMKTFLANPCTANPLGCAIDGASPELKTCLTGVLGEATYTAIGSGQRTATGAELSDSQHCLDQFGSNGSTGGTQGQDGSGGGMTFLNNLTAKDWNALITLLLPANESRVMVENLLDQVIAYLNGETDTASLSLKALKAHLTGLQGAELLQLLLQAQPLCTQDELAQIHAGDAGNTDQPVFCNPPLQDLPSLTTQLEAQLGSAAVRIPDEVVVIQPLSAQAPPNAGPLGKDPIATLNKVRLLIRFSLLLPLGLLILVTLFGVRSLKGWLRWWGIPFFISGLIIFIIGIAILPTLNFVWINVILPRFPSALSAGISSLARDLLGSLGRLLTNPIVLEAAILGLLGLAASIVSFFVDGKKSEPASLTPVPPQDV